MTKQIVIKNFRNIDEIKFDIILGKLNFIYGISGTGKTSISKYISNSYDEKFDKPYSYSDKVEWDSPFSSVKVYNEEAMEKLIFKVDPKTGYELFYSEDGEINSLTEELESSIEHIRPHIYAMNEFIDNVEIYFKNCGINFTIERKIHGKSSISKWEKEENKETNIIDQKHYKWIKDGCTFVELEVNQECPFCKKILDESSIEYVEKIVQIDITSLSKLLSNASLQEKIGLPGLEVKSNKSIENFKAEILKIDRYKSMIEKVVGVIKVNTDETVKYSETEIREIITYFDELDKNYLNINTDIIKQIFSDKLELSKKTNIIKSKTNSIVSKNLKFINTKLKMMNIKYKIEKKSLDSNKKIVDYKLVSICGSEINAKNALSTGEKNIISLLLFLLSDDADIAIIDDPVSSFDEFRRKIILDIISEKFKGKTLLILSHDQVFLKFLINNYLANNHKRNSIGNIWAFENFSEQKIHPIIEGDIKNISDFIYENINNSNNYFQNILNLKHYYELNKEGNNDIYNYLSVIYHSDVFRNTTYIKDDIIKNNFFIRHGKKIEKIDEVGILEKINSKFNISLVPFQQAKKINDEDINKLCHYEKFLLFRDYGATPKSERDLYNSVAHFNFAYVHSLNPYKFNYFTNPIFSKNGGGKGE